MRKTLLLCSVYVVLAVALQTYAGDAPVLKSSGLPAGNPEAVLPQGIVVHLRANKLSGLLDSLDDLIMTFVPEKALPPDLQPMLQNPKPVLAFIGMNAFGKPLTTADLAQIFGVGIDKPITLSFYPMAPEEGFVLSLPMSNPEALTGLLMNLLHPRAFEPIAMGDTNGFKVVGTNPDLPQTVYIVCSDDRAYVCGSPEVAKNLSPKSVIPRVAAGGMIPRAIEQYGKEDLTVIVDPQPFKPMLKALQMQYSKIPEQAIQRARQNMLRGIPPQERMRLNMQLKLRLGIANIDQGLDYVEAFLTSGYEVGFAYLYDQLQAMDGMAFSIGVGKSFQRINASVYSQSIKSAESVGPLPLDEIRKAIAKVPGPRNFLSVSGRSPQDSSSALLIKWLDVLKAKYDQKRLPAKFIEEWAAYAKNQKVVQPLESKVPWVLQTVFMPPSPQPQTPPAAFSDYLMQAFKNGAPPAPLTILPGADETLLEQHYAAGAHDYSSNEAAYRAFLLRAGMEQPFYDTVSRSQVQPTAGKAKKVILEHVYTTHSGLFGYSQHELINREIVYYCKQDSYLFVQSGAASGDTWLNNIAAVPVAPVAPALTKLLDLIPQGASSLQYLRVLSQVRDLIEELKHAEDLAHAELDAYLAKIQEIVNKPERGPEFDQKLLAVPIPLPMLSLNYSEPKAHIYCVLVGNLSYPRPKVMPLLADLLKDFTAKADEIGGTIAFDKTSDGRYDAGVVVSTEALALLMKSTVNAFFTTYGPTPEGRAKLKQAVTAPDDGLPRRREVVLYNTLWDFLLEMER